MAPSWAPTLAQVAVHIPTRTREVGAADDYAGTFNASTTPTSAEVTELVAQACTFVTSRTGLPIVTTPTEVPDTCALAAALWAAYWVELAYPERDADLAVYDRLRTDAEAATKAAVALNTAAGGGATTDPPDGGGTASTALPSHSFPAAPAWADASPGTFW